MDFDVDDEDGLLARASFLRGVSLTKAPDHTYRVPDLSSLSLSEEEADYRGVRSLQHVRGSDSGGGRAASCRSGMGRDWQTQDVGTLLEY